MGSQKHVVLDVTHQMIQKYVMHGNDGFRSFILIVSWIGLKYGLSTLSFYNQTLVGPDCQI